MEASTTDPEIVQSEEAAVVTRPQPLPVQPTERIAAVDVLRGVALLGILVMNIVAFSWPEAVYEDPLQGGGFSGPDRAVWVVSRIVFDEKMMTIFSMLFGAGLVLMSERSAARGSSFAWTYYKRVLWLLVFGLVHAYLIWWGDILVLYAECGLLLYFFRRRSPRFLIALAVLILVLSSLATIGMAKFLIAVEDGFLTERGPFFDHVNRFFQEAVDEINPTPEKAAADFAKSLAAYRGGYFSAVAHRAPQLLPVQTFGFALVLLWLIGPRMLLGMALMKLDVFGARLSMKTYLTMIGLGYGLGVPLEVVGTYVAIESDFHGLAAMADGLTLFHTIGVFGVVFGHIGVVMLICQSGALPWLTRRLAAAGRMALSNYLMQSLICTTLFYGYGFGLFGYVNRTGLVPVVLAVWAFQLTTSVVWLRYFRFGPAEWLWRSLTYGRLRPVAEAAPSGAALLL